MAGARTATPRPTARPGVWRAARATLTARSAARTAGPRSLPSTTSASAARGRSGRQRDPVGRRALWPTRRRQDHRGPSVRPHCVRRGRPTVDQPGPVHPGDRAARRGPDRPGRGHPNGTHLDRSSEVAAHHAGHALPPRVGRSRRVRVAHSSTGQECRARPGRPTQVARTSRTRGPRARIRRVGRSRKRNPTTTEKVTPPHQGHDGRRVRIPTPQAASALARAHGRG